MLYEVITEIGDGLLMMFDSAVQAVRFAISVQTRLMAVWANWAARMGSARRVN